MPAQIPTSFTELASQHATFLSSLAGALLAVLGIVAALDKAGDAAHQSARRDFVLNLLVLLAIAVAGSHCMAEVASFPQSWEDPEKWNSAVGPSSFSHLQRTFSIASVLAYLVGMGFVRSLVLLALYVDPFFNRYRGQLVVGQIAMAVAIAFYLKVSVFHLYEHSAFKGNLNAWGALGLGAFFALAFSALIHGVSHFISKRQTKGKLRSSTLLPSGVSGPFILAVIALLWFIASFLSIAPVRELDVILFSSLVLSGLFLYFNPFVLFAALPLSEVDAPIAGNS